MPNRRSAWAIAIWLLTALACATVVWQTRFVGDLSAFMPKMPTARQQMLADQLRDGIVARIVMVGIDGGTAAQRAQWSSELAAALRRDPAFLGVQNGDAASQEKDQAYFFTNRYLLSPAVNAERFSPAGLKAAIDDSMAALAGDSGLFLKHIFTRDPTAETLQLLDQVAGVDQPNRVEGVWASRDGKRAVLILQTRAAGSNLDAQAQAQARIREVFAAIPHKTSDAQLVMSGTGVFSVSSRQTIQQEVHVLATAGFVLVCGLLLLVFRSPWLLLAGALPIVSGALAGVAAVSLVFGHVHGLTLAFGTTLIGEAVDYAIYLFIQQAGGFQANHFWRTIRLGVLTSIAGFAALVFSSFPGLSQLGVYSITGLVAAVLMTRYVLPHLMPQHVALRSMSRMTSGLMEGRNWASRHLRWLPLALAGLAIVWIVRQDRVWNDQLSGVNPTSQAEQALDGSLRADLGAPDLRYVASFIAPTEQAALEQAETAAAALKHLVDEQALGGFNSPSLALPSLKSQQQRQQALPEPAVLRQTLENALADGPVKAAKLQPFLDDVAANRARALLTRADLSGTSAAMLVDSLIVPRPDGFLVMLPLRATQSGPRGDEIDVNRVEQALRQAQLADASVIDVLDETRQIFAHYLHEALVMTGLGALAVLVVLGVSLKSPVRTMRVALPLACAVLVMAAALLASGQKLTILHLVGLLLVVAVGSNYALFFESGVMDERPEVRQQTLLSLLIANLTTAGSFGLLGFSKVPVLAAVGLTVAPGAILALVFSAILCRPAPSEPIAHGIAPP